MTFTGRIKTAMIKLDEELFIISRPPSRGRQEEVGIGHWLEPSIQPTNMAVRVSNEVPPPDLLTVVAPDFATGESRPKVNGMVVLYAEINANGLPQNIRVIRTLETNWTIRRLKAVKKWRFERRGQQSPTVVTAIGVDFYAP
jgi:hypothetical protein